MSNQIRDYTMDDLWIVARLNRILRVVVGGVVICSACVVTMLVAHFS